MVPPLRWSRTSHDDGGALGCDTGGGGAGGGLDVWVSTLFWTPWATWATGPAVAGRAATAAVAATAATVETIPRSGERTGRSMNPP